MGFFCFLGMKTLPSEHFLNVSLCEACVEALEGVATCLFSLKREKYILELLKCQFSGKTMLSMHWWYDYS